MEVDALGRPRRKVCPGCKAEHARTKQLCSCGHRFIGKEMARAVKLGKCALRPLRLPVSGTRDQLPVSGAPLVLPVSGTFDAIAQPNGGLRLLRDGEAIDLTPREAQIVALELRGLDA